MALMMCFVCNESYAYDIAVENADGVTIYYNYFNGGRELQVTSKNIEYSFISNSYSGSVVIPEEVTFENRTRKVTSIGERAFEYCWRMSSITIPGSVTSIGERAFSSCSGLSSITIPSSVTSIGNNAFSSCNSLNSVHISDLEAWCKIFFGNISSTPLFYANHLYVNESEITNLVIPNSVTSIGDYAFSSCSGLTSVTIPGSVTSIGNGAFSYCSGLTSVTIPGSVTSIGERAFSGCSALTSIAVENGNMVYDSRDNCNAIIKTSTNELIAGCKNTTIPSSVTSIGNGAFSGCSGLSSITIPSSVTSIGNNAFSSCSGLTSITIPGSVTSIGDYAFSGCRGLTSITIPGSVTSIGESVIMDCDSLTSVTIQDGVTSIGKKAFYECRGLTSVTIPGSVTSIGNYAFSGCYDLSSVTIQDGVTSIGERAFGECWSLTSFTIPNSVTSIGESAFWGCSGLTSITIPGSVTSIGDYAFSSCRGLTSVTIPGSVTSIGNGAFSGCSGLVSVVSLIEKPFAINGKSSDDRTFSQNTFNNATLYVPAGTIDKYKATAGWQDFLFIEERDVEKCAKPTIHYQNGKLTFKCETEGVGFVSEITDADIKKSYVAEADLSVTYHITVCATKAGYANSEMAKATLCWIDVEPQKEGITEDDEDAFAEVKAMPVLIQSDSNGLMVSGLKAGTAISVYDLSGKLIGNTTSTEGLTRVQAATSEKVAIVKVGERSVKVLK